MNRARDAFRLKLPANKAKDLVLRVSADRPVELSIQVAKRAIGTIQVPGDGAFTETAIALPPDLGGDVDVIVTLAKRNEKVRFGSFHYWAYAEP